MSGSGRNYAGWVGGGRGPMRPNTWGWGSPPDSEDDEVPMRPHPVIHVRTAAEEAAWQRQNALRSEEDVLRRLGAQRTGQGQIAVGGFRAFSGQAFRMGDETTGRSRELDATHEGTIGHCRLYVRVLLYDRPRP